MAGSIGFQDGEIGRLRITTSPDLKNGALTARVSSFTGTPSTRLHLTRGKHVGNR